MRVISGAINANSWVNAASRSPTTSAGLRQAIAGTRSAGTFR